MSTAVDGRSATALEVRGVSQGERARMVQELASQAGATAVVACDHERELFSIALSTAFAILAAQPRLREQATVDPALVPGAVEELLQADGPVVFVLRVATRDVELGGQVTPVGSHVGITLLAAGRDPARHHDPDVVDFRRREPHLGFGGGPHRHLGSHLARMEMRVAVEEWHRRIPDYELAPGVTRGPCGLPPTSACAAFRSSYQPAPGDPQAHDEVSTAAQQPSTRCTAE